MTAGELVVNVKIKGGEQATKSLSAISNFLTDISAAGLAAKTAILAAFYAVERLTTASGAFGNKISNLNLLTGVSKQHIQQMEEYMRLKGVDKSAADQLLMAGSNVYATAQQTGHLPEALQLVSRQMGFDFWGNLGNTQAYADNLKKYAQTSIDPLPIRLNRFKQLGGNDESFAAFVKQVKGVTEDWYKITSNIRSDDEIAKLDKVHQAYLDLAEDLARLRDRFSEAMLPVIQFLETFVRTFTHAPEGRNEYPAADGSIDQFHGMGTKKKEGWRIPYKLPPSDSSWDFLKPSKILEEFKKNNNLFPSPKNGSSDAAPTSKNTSININHYGLENTHASVEAHNRDVLYAWRSFATDDTVAG